MCAYWQKREHAFIDERIGHERKRKRIDIITANIICKDNPRQGNAVICRNTYLHTVSCIITPQPVRSYERAEFESCTIRIYAAIAVGIIRYGMPSCRC